jgi:hypothetical protein
LKCFFLLMMLFASPVHASVEWTLQKQFNLEASPFAMVPAADGRTVYVLIPGKIAIYSISENRVIDFMPVDRKFDHLFVTGKDKLFLLSSSKDNSISIFERKKTMDYSGLPYQGPPDARVVVAVFSDYQ